MTQYATSRKEMWWEIDAPTTLIWPESISNAQIVLNFGELVEQQHSVWSHLLTSDLTMSTVIFPPSVFDLPDEPIRRSEIEQNDLPDREPYLVKKPIPVVVERESETDFIASFPAGNVSIGGESFRDAFQWLVCEILDTFDALIECESSLGPNAKRQLDILSDYIAKTDGATR